jgi:hypothetical protein
MERMPKYTAGMFKKKMPRFGASSIRLPRLKKYAEGGMTEEMENEKKVAGILNQPETAKEKKARELAKKAEEKAPGMDADQPKKAAPKKPAAPQQPPERDGEVIVTPEEGKKELEKDRLKDLEQYIKDEEAKRKDKFGLNKPPQTPKAIKLRNGGSVASSASRRGDGCAMRGKTKGRFV